MKQACVKHFVVHGLFAKLDKHQKKEIQEVIEDIQAVITSGQVREEAVICLEEVEEVKRPEAGGSGGSLYWTLMSKTFLKKLLPSHKDENDVVCD